MTVPGSALRTSFIDAMSRAATTVTIVTTDGPAGRAGMTVSAMASVSADGEQPTLLVCINRNSRSASTLLANGVFCVNLLQQDQAHISDIFARQGPIGGGDKFACTRWTAMASGVPRLADPLVAFDCRLIDNRSVGSHDILLGSVGDVFISGSGGPLVYAGRSYGAVQRIHEVALRGRDKDRAALSGKP